MTVPLDDRRSAGSLTRVLALALSLGVLGAAPARSQWFGFNDGPLPPGAIVRALMQQGFADIGRPRFNGRVYVVDGVNARGTPVRLVIDAFDGGVISRTRLDGPLLPPREIVPPRGRPGDRFEEAEVFAPPRSIPRPDRYDPREAEPRRAGRPEFYDPREVEPRRAERSEPRQNRAGRAEPPPLREGASPGPAPTREAAEPADPRLSTPRVETATPTETPAASVDRPSTTAAITSAPLAPPATETAPPASPAPAAVIPSAARPAPEAKLAPDKPPLETKPAREASAAEPSRPVSAPAAAGSPPSTGAARPVRVIQGVTPIGPAPQPAAPQRPASAE